RGRELVERKLPAADRVGEERLGHAERRRERLPLVVVPAVQRRDVRKLAVGEEAQDLELGVDARLELAEHLEDNSLVEHDRGVRLLDPHRPDGADSSVVTDSWNGWKLNRPSSVSISSVVAIRRSSSCACWGSASAS